MSKVVQFLENLGRNPELLSEQEYADAVAALQLDADAAAIVLNRDAAGMAELLEAPPVTFCGLVPAEEEEPLKEDEPDDEGDRDTPDQQSAALAA